VLSYNGLFSSLMLLLLASAAVFFISGIARNKEKQAPKSGAPIVS